MITILKGDIAYSENKDTLVAVENGFLIAENEKIIGVFQELPIEYQGYKFIDHSGKLIIPGMIDLHIHAAQYGYRGTGMDLELLDWLDKYAFHEETKFADEAYAELAYGIFVENMKKSATTRLCTFASRHRNATNILMKKLEDSGLISYVGKVNMDRNAPDPLREPSAIEAKEETIGWIEDCISANYKNTYPILTPRFVPSCTDDLMGYLSEIRTKYNVAVQSHLSENPSEIEFVKELCPDSKFYGDVYDKYGMLGRDHTTAKPVKTIMSHCIYSSEEECALMKENGVFIAHCPSSNFNVTSGIAPVKRYLEDGFNIGLGSDVAGGETESIFSSMIDAIKASNMRKRYVDPTRNGLTFPEAFYLATLGGGAFFGQVGSFKPAYAFDAVVLDDSVLLHPQPMTIAERLERSVYLGLDEKGLVTKYVNGKKIV